MESERLDAPHALPASNVAVQKFNVTVDAWLEVGAVSDLNSVSECPLANSKHIHTALQMRVLSKFTNLPICLSLA
jgi:hypothetical protein